MNNRFHLVCYFLIVFELDACNDRNVAVAVIAFLTWQTNRTFNEFRVLRTAEAC